MIERYPAACAIAPASISPSASLCSGSSARTRSSLMSPARYRFVWIHQDISLPVVHATSATAPAITHYLAERSGKWSTELRSGSHISTATYRLLSCHGIALITTAMESPIAPFAARRRCECMQRAASGELPDSDAHELGHRSASYRLHPHAHRAVQFKGRHMRALDCIRPRELASRDHASPSKCARTVTAAR